MKSPPAFQLYAADFLTDTAEWTVDEMGIYIRLLMYEWINGDLPSKPIELAKLTQCGVKKFSKCFLRVSKKFKLNGTGRLQNERLEEEREKQKTYRENQAESGRRGIKVKKDKGIYPFNNSSDPSSEIQATLDLNSSDPLFENQALQSSSSKDIRIYSSCPHKKIIELYHDILPELARIKEWTPLRSKMLKKRWNEKKDRQNLEWWKGYFEYVKKSKFLMGDKTDFQADLEWLIRPNNFVKVIEGRYENNGGTL